MTSLRVLSQAMLSPSSKLSSRLDVSLLIGYLSDFYRLETEDDSLQSTIDMLLNV